ncbi:unnamed protein product [Tetraodon nigroviridis]|uniref:tRNA-dihydrouridine(47) synthase [NAD(P)(+)] n=1 Tax=Tetraodon nigroviridis TaxID=99883 RepID=Q4RLC5_TETNG|nr:unnamed protein product [Tetraodon nigroviridis]
MMEKPVEATADIKTEAAIKGEAAIKQQFLTTKEKFHEFVDLEWQSLNRGNSNKDEKSVDSDETNFVEPDAKKAKLDREDQTERKSDGKRLRGQNKSRPHIKPTTYEEKRLCLSVIQENKVCTFGDKCHFYHSVSDYMSTKPADIGERCYLYDTFGRCAYGFSCRFAKAHTTPDFKTVENADVIKACEGRTSVKNSLSKDLQNRLRKHSVDFKKSTQRFSRGGAACDPWSRNTRSGHPRQLDFGEDCRPSDGCGRYQAASMRKKTGNFDVTKWLNDFPKCGNLPFRRVCKRFGADITCGEMAMCTNLLQGQQSEWALLKRHESEDVFGVQIEGCFPDTMTRCAELINNNTEVDFVDINSGCPIDLVFKKGGGCGLMTRTRKFEEIVKGMNYVLDVPLTVKIRTGVQEKTNIAHKLIPEMKKWGVSMITLHGRSREQRYTKLADWDYISTCSKLASPVPLFGNGDILSYEDAMMAKETGVSGIMIARGALIKPWIFTEIKEKRHWDISSGERLDILRDFTNFGLEHWGSDTRGVEKTRSFMLEWLSFMCRYIPVGLLERVPQKINERPPYYLGRDYLESLMASQNVGDWVRISEMLLGPVPKNFNFLPKHKANAYK